MCAASNGNTEIIERLLAHPRIKPNAKNKIFGGDMARRYAFADMNLTIIDINFTRLRYVFFLTSVLNVPQALI